MDHRQTSSHKVWRPPVTRNRDVWRELPDIRARRRTHTTFRWAVDAFVVVLAAAAFLLVGSLFFVPWLMP